MDVHEDVFCDFFYRWWREQTVPQPMTSSKATKITADCAAALKRILVPRWMPIDAFTGHMVTAQKVILFNLSWDEAKAKSVDEIQQ